MGCSNGILRFGLWSLGQTVRVQLQIWGIEFKAPSQMGVPRERPWPGEVTGDVSVFSLTPSTHCAWHRPSPHWVDLVPRSLSWGGSGLVDCLANGGMGGPSVLSVTVKDTFTKLEIWLSFCPILICKSCPLILKLTQVCGLGPDFRHLLVVGNF